MGTFPAYTVALIDALPLESYVALLREGDRLRHRRMADLAYAVAIGMSKNPGEHIQDLLSD